MRKIGLPQLPAPTALLENKTKENTLSDKLYSLSVKIQAIEK